MSWTSMNGVNQAKQALNQVKGPQGGLGGGMLGTYRAPQAAPQLAGQAQAPGAVALGRVNPAGQGAAQAYNGGMMGSIQRDMAPTYNDTVADFRQNGNNQGVTAGNAPPQLAPGPQAPAFDPNDPNNAALAGYMAR